MALRLPIRYVLVIEMFLLDVLAHLLPLHWIAVYSSRRKEQILS